MATSISITARNDARELLRLLKAGDSPEDIRRTIAPGPLTDPTTRQLRNEMLLAFDCLIAKHRFHGAYRRPRIISQELRHEIAKLLRAGLPHTAVREQLPGVGPGIVMAVGKEIGAAFLKTHGRGRRLSSQLKSKIREAVKQGRRSAHIERELQVDYDTVQRFRHELGDFENRRHWRRLSAAQTSTARTMLLSGVTWKATAANFGVGLSTLQSNLPGFRTGRASGPQKRQYAPA